MTGRIDGGNNCAHRFRSADSNGMSETDANAIASPRQAKKSLVLMVSQSGLVCSVVEAAPAMQEQFAAQPDSLSIDQLWSDELAAKIRSALKRVIRSRESSSLDVDNADGTVQEFILVPQGRDRILMIIRDLTAQSRSQRRTRKLAYTDDVTGLPNREQLLAELGDITDVQRLKEGRSAVICIHVGQFDDYGYALSSSLQDDVLSQLAKRLQSGLRGSNKDGITNFERYSVVGRTDYRQFCVVLPSIDDGEDAEAVAERLIQDLKLPVKTADRTVTVRACGGIALFPQDGTDSASLYENAIAAMEDARSTPNTAIKFHSGTVRLRTLQRSDLASELKSALQNGGYDLNFLPIVDANTGAAITMEALLRWPDAVLGSEPTRKIIRVAERTGLILKIGDWVLRNACEQLQVWHAAGHTDIRVAVNLSEQELVSDGTVERVEQTLIETNTRAEDLDIELKEQILFREVQSGFAVCSRLKALGVRLVVDDYGIGTSSLAHLSQSPIDALKIDNSFVTNIDKRERDRAACAAALAMAAELGIEVIAEGIETTGQAEILRSLGCRYLQGFLMSRPMTAGDALAFLDANAAGKVIQRGAHDRL